jgi:hypothetical protein
LSHIPHHAPWLAKAGPVHVRILRPFLWCELSEPTLWRPKITIAEDHERLDPALTDLVKDDQRVTDFMKRLTYAIEEMVRKK